LGTPNGGQASPTSANNIFNVANSTSIGSIINLAANVSGNGDDVALNASTPTGLAPMSANGEFNQYQLDSSNVNGANEENLIESTLSLTASISSNLIHSSSVSNLQQTANAASPEQAKSNAAISASKSIHSFSTPSTVETLDDKSGKLATPATNANSVSANSNNNTVTKFMKQSPDNISQREVCATNAEKVSIGCQTISTGDVAVINVYIE
jgi:hypothetical protein